MIKYFKKGWGCVLFLLIILTFIPNHIFPQTATPNLRMHARSVVLMDALSGQVLYEQNPRLKMAPASFVKLLTLFLAFDNFRKGYLKMEDQAAVGQRAWKMGGSKMFLKIGERVKMEDLLKGIAIVSGNDACITLTEYIAGSEDVFVLEMNKKAQLLGLNDSQFKNSHGMPVKGQYTTAFDIATLAQHYIKEHPEALLLHSTKDFEYSAIRQQNRNTLLQKNIGVDGLMTGYLEEAGYHLVATAKRDGQRMIAVVMGCSKEPQRAQDARALIEFGFKNFSTLEVFKKDTLFGPERVARGKRNQVDLLSAEEGWVTVAKGKESSISVISDIPKFITAPVQKGQVVGKVLIQSGGKLLREIPLLASSDIPKGIPFLWLLLGGSIIGIMLIGIIIHLRIHQRHRKRL